MNNQEFQNNISKITNLYNKMISISTHPFSCFESLAFINGYFGEGLQKILQLKDPNFRNDVTNEQLIQLREACEEFLPLFRFIHKYIWPEASRFINIRYIFVGIYQFMNTVSNLFESMNLGVLQLSSPIDSCIERALILLREYYTKIIKDKSTNEEQKEHVQSQLDQVSTIKPSDLKNDKTKEPKHQLIFEHFTKNKRKQKKETQYENYPFTRYSTTKENQLIIELTFKKAISEERYQKQILLLSTLKKNVLPIAEASFTKEETTCIFKFNKDILPLKENLTAYKKGSIATSTKFVIKIAEALNYLHSRGIVHGNLCLESVLYSIDKTNIFVYLWNFGLSNNNKADGKMMPPELSGADLNTLYVSSDSTITPEVDIYQFGLLMYQIAMHPDPYNNLDVKNLEKHCTPEMINLIKDCLNQDPSQRPTISNIISRFRTQEIYLLCDDDKQNKNCQEKTEAFINQDRFRNLQNDSKGRIFKSIIDEVEEFPSCKLRTINGLKTFLNETFNAERIGKEQRNQYLRNLDQYCFFEKIIRFFEADNSNSATQRDFVNSYIKIFQPDIQEEVFGKKSIKREFLYNGGDKVIANYMKKDGALRKLSLILLDNIMDSLNDECEKVLKETIIPELVDIKGLDYIKKIIDHDNISNDCKVRIIEPKINEISPLYKEAKYSDDVSDILNFYLQFHDEKIQTINISSIFKFQDALELGNPTLLQQLMKFQSFLSSLENADIDEAVKSIFLQDRTQGQKECFLLLLISLGDEFFETISEYNELIDKVLQNPCVELSSRFIARVTLFSSACNYILTNIIKHGNEYPYNSFVDCENPWLLLSLSRIAGFYPKKVSKIDKIKQNLIRNLDQAKNVEGSLRLLGVLSQEKDFWTDLEVAKSLISLFHKNISTPYEKTILLSLISNLTLINETKAFFSSEANYLQFVSEVENKGKDSGLSLRILSRLDIPNELERGKEILILRLTNIIRDQLQNGNKFGVEGSSQLIIAMVNHFKDTPEFEIVINSLKNIDIYSLLISASRKENNITIFIKLMDALYTFEPKSYPEVTSLYSNMIMNFQGTIPEKFNQLKLLMSQ